MSKSPLGKEGVSLETVCENERRKDTLPSKQMNTTRSLEKRYTTGRTRTEDTTTSDYFERRETFTFQGPSDLHTHEGPLGQRRHEWIKGFKSKNELRTLGEGK